MSRSHVALIGAAALVVSLATATPALAAPAAAPAPDPVIAQGVLYDPDGTTAAAGELVTVTAWPSSEVLTALADGDVVPTVTAGTATTDASGAWLVTLDDPAAVAELADSDGTVDYTVDSITDGVVHTFGFSQAAPEESALAARATTAPVTTVALRPLKSSSAAATTSQKSAVAAAVGCNWLKLSTIGPRWVVVGEGYTTTSVAAKLTYTSGSSSTLGIGASVSGTSGSFSASGSNTVSSSGAITMPTITGNVGRRWSTQFVYSKFGYACSGASSYQSYEVRATSFAGGALASTASAPAAIKCTLYQAGAVFTKSSTNASTFSTGASLGGDIGINLSSKTGFTSTTKIAYTFAATHSLCGVSDYPGGSPGRIVAKP